MYTSDKFYDEFAKSYDDYSKTKGAYLRAVEKFIKSESVGGGSLLDVGGGDGKRLFKIAKDINAKDLTLVDQSAGMISLINKDFGISVLQKDISDSNFILECTYNTVVCLWNVLGHIPTEEKRLISLSNIAKCLRGGGVVFLDVNNRYNISHYGFLAVTKNVLRDIFHMKNRGDYLLSFDADKRKISTTVHVFSPFEIQRLIKLSGLRILKRKIIDYRTGEKAKGIWGGQLVYKLSIK